MKIKFEEVSLVGVKRWKDRGRWRTQRRKFSQTINPFNKMNGRPKTRQEILSELTKERDAWLRVPPTT